MISWGYYYSNKQVQLQPMSGEAGCPPRRAATIRSTNQRTAASPLHTDPDSPGGPTLTEPPVVSACLRYP